MTVLVVLVVISCGVVISTWNASFFDLQPNERIRVKNVTVRYLYDILEDIIALKAVMLTESDFSFREKRQKKAKNGFHWHF